MPGRLGSDQEVEAESQGLKRENSDSKGPSGASERPEGPFRAEGPRSISSNGVLTNGVLPHDELEPGANGTGKPRQAAPGDQNSPPPLDQSWRALPVNKSLGTMLERAAQQCYLDLNEVLTKMSELGRESQTQQANGITNNGVDSSQNSLAKKRLMLDFANSHRDRFIRSLVLSDWCRNGEQLSKLIDVKVWQDSQLHAQNDAAFAIGQLKIDQAGVKMPNPNLRGAMEVLGTGKASWAPDLGYLPSKPLSAKKMLKALRNMNVTLATRLSLHEDLPPYFDDFTIANGRATFTVPDEFEVDVSIADEALSSQFFFIDFRFLFSPVPSTPNDNLIRQMESKANFEMDTKGLKGCYDLLHNFVLTHKISVLWNQAQEMRKGKWFECLNIEIVHRRLIVQYWTQRKGPKSWIEIGISSGKARSPTARRLATPHLVVRWFRRGEEVQDDPLTFNFKTLDFEKYLSMVISKDVCRTLAEWNSRILASAPSGSRLTALLNTSGSAEDYALTLNMPSLKSSATIGLDLVTGQVSVTPFHEISKGIEDVINDRPNIDPARYLVSMLCSMAQERTGREAKLLGWSQTAGLARQADLDEIFGDKIRHITPYTPSSSWGVSWALAVTLTLAGEKWWVISLEDQRDNQGQATGRRVITHARHIAASAELGAISRTAFKRIERLAISEVAFGALVKQLTEANIPHRFSAPSSTKTDSVSTLQKTSTGLFMQMAPLMASVDRENWKPWAADPVCLIHHGFALDLESPSDVGQLRHDLRLTIEPGKMKQLKKHLTYTQDSDLAMSASGGLALRFLTPFGQPFLAQIKTLLQNIERLDANLATLKEHNYNCTHASLARLSFTYSESPRLSAEILFSPTGHLPARLTLSPKQTNPHSRLRLLLEQSLNTPPSDAYLGSSPFRALVAVLSTTLPLLSALSSLPTLQPVNLHVHSPTHYSLAYSLPYPDCALTLRLQPCLQADSRSLRWFVQEQRQNTDASSQPEQPIESDFHVALRQEMWMAKGEGWRGLGNGVDADAKGVADVVNVFDRLMRRFQGSNAEQEQENVKLEDDRKEKEQAMKEKAPDSSTAAAKKGESKAAAPAEESQQKAKPPNQKQGPPQAQQTSSQALRASQQQTKAQSQINTQQQQQKSQQRPTGQQQQQNKAPNSEDIIMVD